jgi:hypothetical protein
LHKIGIFSKEKLQKHTLGTIDGVKEDLWKN